MKQVSLTILVIAYLVAFAIADQVWLNAKQDFFTKPGQAVDLQKVFLELPSDIFGINRFQRKIEIFAGRTKIVQIKNVQGVAVRNALRWDRAGQVDEVIILLEPLLISPMQMVTRAEVFRDKKQIRAFSIFVTLGELEYRKVHDLLEHKNEKDLK